MWTGPLARCSAGAPTVTFVALSQFIPPPVYQRAQSSTETPEISSILVEYHDLGRCSASTKISPYYHTTLMIAPLTSSQGLHSPKLRLYNLSRPKRVTVETYINASLASGIICLSSSPISPVGVDSFFVGKRWFALP